MLRMIAHHKTQLFGESLTKSPEMAFLTFSFQKLTKKSVKIFFAVKEEGKGLSENEITLGGVSVETFCYLSNCRF